MRAIHGLFDPAWVINPSPQNSELRLEPGQKRPEPDRDGPGTTLKINVKIPPES